MLVLQCKNNNNDDDISFTAQNLPAQYQVNTPNTVNSSALTLAPGLSLNVDTQSGDSPPLAIVQSTIAGIQAQVNQLAVAFAIGDKLLQVVIDANAQDTATPAGMHYTGRLNFTDSEKQYLKNNSPMLVTDELLNMITGFNIPFCFSNSGTGDAIRYSVRLPHPANPPEALPADACADGALGTSSIRVDTNKAKNYLRFVENLSVGGFDSTVSYIYSTVSETKERAILNINVSFGSEFSASADLEECNNGVDTCLNANIRVEGDSMLFSADNNGGFLQLIIGGSSQSATFDASGTVMPGAPTASNAYVGHMQARGTVSGQDFAAYNPAGTTIPALPANGTAIDLGGGVMSTPVNIENPFDSNMLDF